MFEGLKNLLRKKESNEDTTMCSFAVYINDEDKFSSASGLYLHRALQWSLWQFQEPDKRKRATTITIRNSANTNIEIVLENEQEVTSTAQILGFKLDDISKS